MLNKRIKTIFVYLSLIFLVGISSVNGQPSDCKSVDFNLAREYQTGRNAYSFTSADLNGDGITDVITPNFEAQTVSVAYGDGAGGFAPPRFFATELNIRIVAAGDLNNDGKPDLIAPHINLSKFTVLLNNGQNGFSAPMVITFPNSVTEFYDLKIGDFNGDGNADVAGMARTNLYLFFGNGQGSFTLNATLPWDGDNARIAVGNFNNDNLTDLAIITGESNYPWELVVILGTASGNFTYNNRYSLINRPSDIALGDFNGDGLTDIVISANYPFQNSTPQTFYLQPWFGNGGGSFIQGEKSYLPSLISGIAVGDFNGDGKSDLAAQLPAMTATVNGIGNGTFQRPAYWTTPTAQRIIAADANRDGKKDLISVRAGNSVSYIWVVPGSTSGLAVSRAIPYGTTDIEAADFNNDGLKDFVSAYRTDFGTSEVTIALNDANGGFLPDQNFETPANLKAFKIGDFNGDGKKDVITAHNNGTRQLAVYLGNGSGAVAAPILTSINVNFENLIVGDFNTDGKDDVFAVGSNAQGYALLGVGNGTFAVAPNSPVALPSYYAKLEKGDFNRDGKLDLVITDSDARLWLGTGNGQFNPSATLATSISNIVVGDFNSDGNLDLAGFSGSSSSSVLKGLLGDGRGGISGNFSQSLIGDGSQLIAGDFNADGSDDVAYNSFNFTQVGNLIVVPSGGQTAFWKTPLSYSVAGMGTDLLAADYNADGKPDIGYTSQYAARGTIINSASQTQCVSINDVTVTEGDSGTTNAVFTVSLSAASSQTVRVNYTLAAQTAVIGEDLQNISGRLEIPAGQTAATINVPINGDIIDEFDETFTVNLTSPINAALGKSTGTGTILDNDAEPSMTITDVSQVEPTFSQGTTFRVNLSAPSAKPISFRCSTADGTATAGKDYLAANLTVNFQSGAISADCYVNLLSDNIYELDETFFVNLSEVTNAALTDAQGLGKILNDDPIPSLSVFSNSIAEGDFGTFNAAVSIQLSNPSYLPITFNVLTGSGTAVAGSDYIASDTVVTVPAEQQTVSANVQIIGDTINEPNETFFVNLYNVSNATLGNTQALYTIIDDESVSSDFDRDGKTDFAVFRPADGTWYTLFSSTGGFTGTRYGVGTDTPVSGDYNSDGRTDIAVWRPSNGTWYTPIANRTQQWGTGGDIPVQGDYDNDGKIDVAVFRPSNGYWYIQQSSNNSFRYVLFGANGDIPVPADFDGDGKTDIAVFRPSSGTWYIVRSSNNTNFAVQFGQTGDKLIPADYDGDGKADIAVFRDGIWYLLRSSAGNAFSFFQWGQAGDKAVPGNYDGDDKTDFAVYRNGVWYIYQSSNGVVLSKQFGAGDDIPIPFVSNN